MARAHFDDRGLIRPDDNPYAELNKNTTGTCLSSPVSGLEIWQPFKEGLDFLYGKNSVHDKSYLA